ncbi:M15 family metallopeptidase [Paenibacillus sp. sgz500958]|uniref:M15 family metallopeptidase n=1 Tax=Paenibacillus sp. sgz500958 TaxID=3242475 RepID=UPI0036D2CCAC
MTLTLEQVKSKSSARLVGLQPVVLAAVLALIERSFAAGVPIIITQGLRTIAEQDALYAQGRSKPGSIVTNAKGGYSYHNYGLAVDFALLLPDGKSVSWDMNLDGDKDKLKDWDEVIKLGNELGFEWGGDWTSFKDYPHLQMTFGLSLAQLRAGTKPAKIETDKIYTLINKLACEDETVSKETKVSVLVNGVKIADGYLDAGTTLVPARAIAEAFGASISYDVETKTVNITKKSMIL